MKIKKELVIAKKPKKDLNKQQLTFNRLVKKLEKLRSAQKNVLELLNEKLTYYGKHIHPLEKEIAELHKQSAKTFYQLYHGQKIPAGSDKEILMELIASQISQFTKFSSEEPDGELKEIFEFVEGESYEEAVNFDFQAMKDDMSETFRDLGIEIDLDGFTADMSEEELMRKMAEMLGEVKEQAETKSAEKTDRKKSTKQIEKEVREKQIEEAKNKDISKIYKQLARVFHPDLEPDEKRKLEKEDLMKKLTDAHQKGDLHTLLHLELEWLHREESHLEKLSAEKLRIYNQALREQIEELELEILSSTQNPRYSPLQKYADFLEIDSVNLKHEKQKLEYHIQFMKKDLMELNSEKPQKKLKEIIRETKKELKHQQMLEIDLEDWFG